MQKLATCIATGFYSGLFPKAPGTAGSALAVLLCYGLIYWTGPEGLDAFFLASLIIGTWATHLYEKGTGRHDAPEVVVDEFAGQALALYPVVIGSLGMPSPLLFSLAFVLFRLFDIWKPWPIRRMERWPGAIGVMADDLMAGLYAGIALGLLDRFLL